MLIEQRYWNIKQPLSGVKFDSFNDIQNELTKELSKFEALFVPDDFKRAIPEEYSNLPALQGRAEVEMVIVKPDGSQYDIDGVLYNEVIYHYYRYMCIY